MIRWSVLLLTVMSVAAMHDETTRIGLIGDSTVAQQSGWGPALPAHFNDKVKVINYAKNGATLQSLSKRLDVLLKLKPDYVLIQFGHNDQKRYDTSGYGELLKSYVKRVKESGGKPVILSSVVRRSFGNDGTIVANMVKSERYSYRNTLDAYAKKALDVAAELDVPFIDLYGISAEHHNRIGRDESMTYNFKEGDRTHFNRKGAEAIVGLILPELLKAVPELEEFVKPAKNGGKASMKKEKEAFDKAAGVEWKEVFSDACMGDWKEKWFLDGKVGTVTNTADGMILTAGPEFKNDAHHMVLWTKDEFKGDLKIEYDYTRLDKEIRCVTILYIQATGSGKAPYVKDISKWSELRKVPSMRTYFNHMNTYHISYAAFGNTLKDDGQYIRGRRYMPDRKGLGGTDLAPDYWPEGLFKTGVKHHITVIKKDRDLYMKVENADKAYFCHMTNKDLPPVTEGRIGLRHMFTRSALYKNLSVATRSGK